LRGRIIQNKPVKIGILTQPLGTNYGGILQAYALQRYLRNLGYNVETIRIANFKNKVTPIIYLKIIVSKLIRILNGEKLNLLKKRPKINANREKLYSFISDNIVTTDLIKLPEERNLLEKLDYDVYIVGSDQVWRKRYSPHMPTFFLDFTKDKDNVRRVAYAASFGLEQWQFAKKETRTYKNLLKKFDAVSLREDSGCKLCERYLDVSCEHVLDPTMLLYPKDYFALYEGKVDIPEFDCLAYILDQSESCAEFLKSFSKSTSLSVKSIIPQIQYQDTSIEQTINYPSVEEWICSFSKCKCVITDSFHGTIFSILFNKPFVVKCNSTRGSARFESLLKMFGLQDRLITYYNLNEFVEIINRPINWDRVETILSRERIKSQEFVKVI
jgi:hypothetical protein